jgi:hypothetical protein
MSKKNYIIINSVNLPCSTDFTYKLAKQIKVHKYMKLLYACIPNTNYMINSENNQFQVSFDDGVWEMFLPIGNYTTNSLAQKINNVMTANNFNITFDDIKVKYQLTASQSFFVVGSACEVLGIEQHQTFDTTNIYAKSSIQFTNPKILYIRINELNNENIVSSHSKNVTFFVHNNALKNENTYYYAYQYDNVVSVESNIIDVNELKIEIMDENFKIYDNLNIPIQLIVEFI